MQIKNKVEQAFQNDFWKKLIKNVTTVLVGNSGSSIINFFVTLIMIHALGNTKYGIFLLALQYMNLLDGIINFQSWAGVIKYGSEAIVDNDEKRLLSIFKSGFMIDIITAVLGTLVAVIILPAISYILKWDNELVFLAMIFSVEIVFHIEGTSVGVLRLFEKFHLTATQSIIAATIKFMLIGIYVLLGGSSLIIITILYVITDVIKHLILVFMAMRVLHEKIGIRKVLKTPIKRFDKAFFKYTIWTNVGYTVDVPVRYFDVFIIGQISVEMVAIYKVFKQMIQILSMLVNPISMAILPQFSELVAKGKEKEAYQKVMKLRNMIFSVGWIVIVASLLVGKPLFNMFLGTEYGDNLFLFMTILIMQIFFIAHVAVHPFFASLGKAKEDFIITLSSNIIYIVVAFVLVTSMGIYAVVLSNVVQGTLCIFMKIWYTKKWLRLRQHNNKNYGV